MELSQIVRRSTTNFLYLPVIELSIFVQKGEEPLSVCCLNVQSLRNKAILRAGYVVSEGFHVISELVASGYEFKHVPLANQKRGGGMGIMYRSGLPVKVSESETTGIYTHFEHMDLPRA